LNHIVALSLTGGVGLVDPVATLLDLPAALVAEAVEEASEADVNAEDHLRALRFLSKDSRATVRMSVAQGAARFAEKVPDAANEILRELARDRAVQVRVAASHGLAVLLNHADAVHRIQLVCEWALAEHAGERAALAQALCSPVRIFAASAAIASLASDRVGEVRELAAQAALHHFHENPQLYLGVLASLANDPDRDVRRLSRRLLTETHFRDVRAV
jgi:hypothetical protein